MLLFLLLAGDVAVGGTDVGGSSSYGTFQYRYLGCFSRDHNWQGTQSHRVYVDTDVAEGKHQIGGEIGVSHTADTILYEPDDGEAAYSDWYHGARLWAAFRHSAEDSTVFRLRGRIGGGVAFGSLIDSHATEQPSAYVSRGFGLLGYELFLGQWGVVGLYSRAQWMIPWSHGTESYAVLGAGLAGGERLPLFTIGMRAAFTYNITLRPAWAQAGLELGMIGPGAWRVRPRIHATLIKERDEDLFGFELRAGFEVRLGALPVTSGAGYETGEEELDAEEDGADSPEPSDRGPELPPPPRSAEPETASPTATKVIPQPSTTQGDGYSASKRTPSTVAPTGSPTVAMPTAVGFA